MTAIGTPSRAPGFALAGFLAWLAVTVGWWTLAFAPLSAPPAWLERTRAVCFGTLPNGLPDTWGWMLLLLGPLSMLTFLVAVWGRDLADALAALARRAAGWLLLAPVAATLVLGGLWVGGRVAAAARAAAPALEEAAEPLPEAYPRTFDAAPPLPLLDQHGAAFDGPLGANQLASLVKLPFVLDGLDRALARLEIHGQRRLQKLHALGSRQRHGPFDGGR